MQKQVLPFHKIFVIITGHDGSMCNADQCGSMCDPILGIDLKCFSMFQFAHFKGMKPHFLGKYMKGYKTTFGMTQLIR